MGSLRITWNSQGFHGLFEDSVKSLRVLQNPSGLGGILKGIFKGIFHGILVDFYGLFKTPWRARIP